MSDKLSFELVSPERLLASVEADMVVVPGEEGDFGVLAGHSLVLSTLRPGVISVYQGENVTQRLFVGSGFAEVNERGLTVLAETADEVEKLDPTAVRQAVSDADEDVRALAADADERVRARTEQAAKIAAARLEALEAL